MGKPQYEYNCIEMNKIWHFEITKNLLFQFEYNESKILSHFQV